MTGDVVDLAERRKLELAYWRCDCGCMTHYLRNDGEVECAFCEVIGSDAGFWRMPDSDDAPRPEREGDLPTIDRIDLGDEDSALGFVLRRANASATAVVVILQEDGRVSVWGHPCKTRERRGWLRRKLEIARKMVVNP